MSASAIKRAAMNRQPIEPTVRVSRGYLASRRAYVFFCASIVFTVVLLTVATFILPPRALPNAALSTAAFPVATIQLVPNRDGLCRSLLFHNTSGRFEDGGTGKCHGLIPDELLVDTVRANRADAIGRVFKIR
jgi:hypothetical protein